jgi:hypothetical protein
VGSLPPEHPIVRAARASPQITSLPLMGSLVDRAQAAHIHAALLASRPETVPGTEHRPLVPNRAPQRGHRIFTTDAEGFCIEVLMRGSVYKSLEELAT